MSLLHDLFNQSTEKYSQRIAFDSVDRQITFQELYDRSKYLAGALEYLDIKQGDRVAILAQNCSDYIAYHYAAAMAGAILLVLNIRHTVDEMLWALNDAAASALILDNNFGSLLSPLMEKCPSIKKSIGIDLDEGVDFSTRDLVDNRRLLQHPPPISEKDPVLLIYTSGTTGRPKGALQTHEGSTMIDALTAEALETSTKDVYLAFMPYFHQAGLIRTRATMLNGGTNLVYGKMDPESVASLFIKKKISITMLPPPYDTFLTEMADKENLKFPSLRFIIGAGGAGPVHAERMQAFCKKFNCRYMGVYGQTEVTGPATIVMGEDYFKNPYTCGKPMRGIDLVIWDEQNRIVPPGTVGEIMIRSKSCVPGYWNNEQGTRDLFSGDWLHTGDLGRLDEQGFLYFVDRKKELIKTGAENVYPREVEIVLEKHPAVADMAIIGLPDPNRWGEVVTAVVVLEPNQRLTLDEMKDFCRGKISGYKIPKILKIVDEIPRNITGKVKKLELRDRFSKEG